MDTDDLKKPKITPIENLEEWLPATKVNSDKTILLSGERRAKILCRAISHDEYETLNQEIAVPEVSSADDETRIYKVNKAKVEQWVRVIDLCAFKIPGESIAEKAAWCENNIPSVSLIDVYGAVLSVSGFQSGKILKDETNEQIVISDAENFAKLATESEIYAFTRGDASQWYLNMFPVPGQKVKEIDLATDPGVPPPEPSRERATRNQMRPNPNHEGYKQTVKLKNSQRDVLLIEAALRLAIPGEKFEQKRLWLGQRPAGEVLNLLSEIRNKTFSYRERTDFI